ncbi:hypothetical protein [Microvirga terrestris]|uniref:DUF4124 domain-containing protein n=1 Tax=Microvirga terrestris TaxID=2791024 RepID=A0ABS0HTK9_9HYPH|nr:hypothetical protein [Microvirga terrestris]MBF9196825.1 hypothetical protein [Microvirga terrestris]
MNKTLILLGATILTHGMMFSGAEARLVRYEINGKQYSYSTNNLAQTAEARKRIAAARAAEAAKGMTEGEKAKEADGQLQQILSGPTEYMAVSQPVRDRIAEPAKKSQDRQARQASVAKLAPRPITVVRAPAKPILASAVASSLVVAEPVSSQQQTKVKSVSFDMQTGIKTIIMIDGTIEEEPFDSSALASLIPDSGKTNSLTAFVNQLRKMAPEESTGSIRTSVAEPEDDSLIRHR